MAYTKYSLTPANNTAAPPDGAPEGMLPSAVNDTMRDMMAQIRDCGDGVRDGTYTMTAVKITGGTINGATIGATTASTGAFTSITASTTLGITGVATFSAGSAAAPAITTTGDTNTGTFFPAADTIAFTEGGAEAMRIDSSGNVGIGVTPSAWGSPFSNVMQFTKGAIACQSNSIQLMNNSYYNGTDYKYVATAGAGMYEQTGGLHVWTGAASGSAGATISFSERMRIDSSGALCINTTSVIDSGILQVAYASGVNNGIIFRTNGTGSQYAAIFNNGNGLVGSITTNASATAYNTSSDYRLKENIAPMIGALATVAQLKPVTYKWKSDGSDGQGFIAHELQAVVPDCVTGEKDAIDKDGKPQYQGMDTSFLIATLVSAIQELKAEFDAYKATHP